MGRGLQQRPLRRVGALVAILAGLLVPAFAGASPARAAGPAFDPATPTVFISQGDPTQLERAVESNGQVVFNDVGTPSTVYNAMAYDTIDNHIYAVQSAGQDILQIDANGGVTDTGTMLILPTQTGSANVGAWDPDNGQVYFTQSPATAMTAYNPATGTMGAITLTAATGVSDMSYADGYFWGIVNASSPQRIARINPATGDVTDFTLPPDFLPGAGGSAVFGAVWTYGNGNLGFELNGTGTIYRISVANAGSANPTFSLVSALPGPATTGTTDGAANPGPPAAPSSPSLPAAQGSTSPAAAPSTGKWNRPGWPNTGVEPASK